MNYKHILRGYCPRHPSRKLIPGRKYCRKCYKRIHDEFQERAKQAKKAGVCYNHPDRKVPQGSVRCAECRLYVRLRGLSSRGGLSKDEIEKAKAAFESFSGVCDSCGCGSEELGKRGWAIDHNHENKTFRGILCTRCNVAIGMAKDNPAKLKAAAKYLEERS